MKVIFLVSLKTFRGFLKELKNVLWNNHKLISTRKNEEINETFLYSYDVVNLMPYFDYLILQIITYFELLKFRTLGFKDIYNGELKCNEIKMKGKIGISFFSTDIWSITEFFWKYLNYTIRLEMVAVRISLHLFLNYIHFWELLITEWFRIT